MKLLLSTRRRKSPPPTNDQSSSSFPSPSNQPFFLYFAKNDKQNYTVAPISLSVAFPNLIDNINILAMENIIKKTNLGIAVQQAITQLGLQRQRTKIMTYLQKSFEQKFEEFKKAVTSSTGTLRGYYVADNEFPIGEHDKQQYFRSIAFQAKIGGLPLTTASNGERRPFTLIEGYSRNDESKKRQYSKSHTKSQKRSTETSGKKKLKK